MILQQIGQLFLNVRDLAVLTESSEQTSNRPSDSENRMPMAGAMAMAWMSPSLSMTYCSSRSTSRFQHLLAM
jgi:hypothetical protein